MPSSTPELPRNPYAPPRADVADVPTAAASGAAPALWNPNAAANWSLLFSPAFGAYLHMLNWRALGDEGKARTSKIFVVCTVSLWVVTLLLGMIAPDSPVMDVLSRVMGLGLLIGWYVTLGRAQAKVVLGRYGKTDPRRGWLKPLGYGVLAVLAFFALGFAVGWVVAMVRP